MTRFTTGSFTETVDISVMRLEPDWAVVRHPKTIPTFHYDGLHFRLMAEWWKFIARIAERAEELFFNQWTLEDCTPSFDCPLSFIKPSGKIARPRLRLSLWSQWCEPLPEMFNATVDPWTKTYGVVA